MRVAFEEYFTRCSSILQRNRRQLYLPMVYGIISNTSTNREFPTVERFLVDSGASISILNSKYVGFFDKANRYDKQVIQYGSGQRVLDVYQIRIMIKGMSYSLIAALDDAMMFEYSLLGHLDFFEQFRAIVFNTNHHEKQKYTTRFIRKF